MYKILQQLKGIMQVTISDKYQKDFEVYIDSVNIERGKITAITFIVLKVMIIIASFAMQKGTFLEKPGVYYFCMYLIMIIGMIIHLFAFVQIGKNVAAHKMAIRIIGVTFAGFILLWCAGISLLDQLSQGQIIIYTLAVICVAVVPFYAPKTSFVIYLVIQGIFIALMPYFQESEKVLFDNCVNSTSFVTLSWVISSVMYKSRMSDFNNSKIIQEKSDELQKINKRLEEANHALARLSYTDSLTNVFNRSFFDRKIKAEWNRCRRDRIHLSLIMIDIDYFKEFNDHYGHQAGDNCIRQVAGVLSGCAKRSADVVARYGGDEFAVILPGAEKGNALEFSELISKQVEQLAFPHAYSAVSNFVTLSLGIKTLIPSNESSIEEFIWDADKALYQAKKDRNEIVST